METFVREVMYVDEIERGSPFFLAVDVGGTNSNFGIFSLRPDKPVLVLSLHYKSKDIEDFTAFIKSVIDYIWDHYAIELKRGCIGSAGIVFPHRVTSLPTNLAIEINTHEIVKATSLEHLFLINDFEAVALGIELMDPKSVIQINEGIHRFHANKAFLGAGTGLGKSLMVWNSDNERYFPVASEGGHADFAAYEGVELAFVEYLKATYNICPASWEAVLSGQGIKKIYHFLGVQKKYPVTDITREIELHDFEPDRISLYAEKDPRCRDVFELYVRFYARCTKNFALEGLALNGVYIAGGIAAKNSALFTSPLFMEEFIRCGKQSKHVATIPVSIIIDYNVSLYGAVVADRLRREGLL